MHTQEKRKTVKNHYLKAFHNFQQHSTETREEKKYTRISKTNKQ